MPTNWTEVTAKDPKLCHKCQSETDVSSIDQILSQIINPITRKIFSELHYQQLCKACAEDIISKTTSIEGPFPLPQNTPLRPGYHYYIENGKWVFTESYHLLKGYCCQNACRHCPYGFK